MFNIFPNGFNKGPYILILFKGFLGPTQVFVSNTYTDVCRGYSLEELSAA